MLTLPRDMVADAIFDFLRTPYLVLYLPLTAQDTAAPASNAASDPGLRPTLEGAYYAWRSAMASKNLEAWQNATTLSRQIQTQNQIVSQRAPFPRALFDDPVQAPTLGGLISLGVLSTGETATSTYFGKPNFGEGEAPISDNLLVLHFMREENVWRFDKIRVVKIGNDGEILLQIRNQDFSFLKGEEFQPAPMLPEIPQPVTQPDFIGELWLSSEGYETEVRVNGHLSAKISNTGGKDLVMGGVRTGGNSIHIKVKKLPIDANVAPRLEVAIYAAKGPGEKAERVFHYRPVGDIPCRNHTEFQLALIFGA